jgi:hypothetical protein
VHKDYTCSKGFDCYNCEFAILNGCNVCDYYVKINNKKGVIIRDIKKAENIINALKNDDTVSKVKNLVKKGV